MTGVQHAEPPALTAPAAVAGSPARRRIGPDLRSLAVAAIGGATMLGWAQQSGFNQDLLLLTGAYALIALGMYVPFVMVGRLSLAYGAYAAMGGYAVALVATKTSWPLLIGWVLGAVVAAVVATIVGLATRRLSNWYLASVTILFATAFESWLQETRDITGGAGGIGGIRDLEILGWALTRDQSIYAAVALVLVVGVVLDRVRLSAWGVTARAVREAPLAVETAGVKVSTVVLVALALGAAVASLGGALFTASVGSITPETFTMHIVFLALFMPLIGGVGTPWGATLGAALVVQLTLNMASISTSGTLILSVGVILMLLVSPNGLLTMADRLRRFATDLVGRRR
jgi:branched-chain amino acid transport system permease protein